MSFLIQCNLVDIAVLLQDDSGKLLKLLEFAIARENYEMYPTPIDNQDDIDYSNLNESIYFEHEFITEQDNWQLDALIARNRSAVEDCLAAIVSACKPLMKSGVFLEYDKRNVFFYGR